MPSQYATLSRCITFSADMIGLSLDLFSDKTGALTLYGICANITEIGWQDKTFRNPIFGHKDNAAFLSE